MHRDASPLLEFPSSSGVRSFVTSDLAGWCLDEALDAADPPAADWLLGRALHAVVTGGAARLSVDDLRERTSGHDRLRRQLQDMLASPVDAARSARRQTWLARDELRRQPLLQAVRAQATALIGGEDRRR